jgi:hypothetical protein
MGGGQDGFGGAASWPREKPSGRGLAGRGGGIG